MSSRGEFYNGLNSENYSGLQIEMMGLEPLSRKDVLDLLQSSIEESESIAGCKFFSLGCYNAFLPVLTRNSGDVLASHKYVLGPMFKSVSCISAQLCYLHNTTDGRKRAVFRSIVEEPTRKER
jgi:hypothetical protein